MHGPSKATVLLLVSVSLGSASVLLGFWMAGYFALACRFVLTIVLPSRGQHGSWRSAIFSVTRPEPIALMLGWIGLVAVLGGLGHRLAGRGSRDERSSLAGSARRLAVLGLVGAGLDALILAGLVGYRLYRLFD